MVTYERNAKYYETDQMGIIHHSNYIRWMEEARIFYMKSLGCGYSEMERRGIVSPVINVNCDYLGMTRFDDDVTVDVRIMTYNGIKLQLEYLIKDKYSGAVRVRATSSHCFLSPSKRPSPLKKIAPDFDAVFARELVKGEELK